MTELLDQMTKLALEAGAKIMSVYDTDFDTREKADGSAVTDADEAAEAIILAGLAGAAPDVPVLAEEAAAAGDIPALGNRFFLVDPLDGTREFVNRTGEFTVNIALIENGRSVAGVVYAPALNRLYTGGPDGARRYLTTEDHACKDDGEAIATRARPGDGLIAVASRSHRSPQTQEVLDALAVSDCTPAGSSLKFCVVAEGKADVYPRVGRTMEWDTGAGQAVLEAAGGRVHELQGTEDGPVLGYNKKERGFDNPFFIAWGR